MRTGKSIARRLAVFACAAAFALSGCNGSVAVHSSFSGGHGVAPPSGPAAPVAPAMSGQGQGLHVAWGSGHLAWVILAGLVVAEVVHWTAAKWQQTFGAKGALAADGAGTAAAVPAVQKCVHPVPAMC